MIRVKRFSFLLLSLFYFTSCISGSLKIGVISDVHYLSPQLMTEGKALDSYTANSGRDALTVPEILNKAIDCFLEEKIDVLFVSGDMTKDGEKQSHLDFLNQLKSLMDKGVKVYVVPGNHDINIPNPLGYSGDKTYKIDNVSPQEFEDIYKDCGYSQALNRDTASLSYVAEIDNNTWLLAVDGCLYKEYKDRSISAGRISANTEAWIKDVLQDAKKQNIRVIGMMHHGLVEHIMFQDMFYPDYLIDDWKRLAAFFADNGVRVLFTGHFHSHDITEFVSDAGQKIYDVETASLSSFPFSYRIVELSDKGMDVATLNVKAIPRNPNLFEDGRTGLKELSAQLIKRKVKEKKPSLSDELLNKIADAGSDVIVLHAQGDEVVDTNLMKKLEVIAIELGVPIDLSSDFLQLDFPPADNNVMLLF